MELLTMVQPTSLNPRGIKKSLFVYNSWSLSAATLLRNFSELLLAVLI